MILDRTGPEGSSGHTLYTISADVGLHYTITHTYNAGQRTQIYLESSNTPTALSRSGHIELATARRTDEPHACAHSTAAWVTPGLLPPARACQALMVHHRLVLGCREHWCAGTAAGYMHMLQQEVPFGTCCLLLTQGGDGQLSAS
jgi:hypothetical protein